MKCFITALMAALASLALAVDPVVDSSVAESTTESVATEVTLLPWPTRRTTTLSTSTSTSSSFIITVTTLPGKPTVTPVACPTVTLTTRPANCQPIRCPIPGCTYEEDMIIPCNCVPRTLLWVEGCQTACPVGCATSTSTLSQLCATATPAQALPSAV
ncbi:hypothetical protein ANO14919_048060 [Xylariales sp. No.14919]|nr:hypothetical protein F5X98DRAFT_376524 [Xylaria grammica]GAW15397.1 hypothetical protein ANO14919_048060 [Xylariales sp. No.14919]